MPPDWWWTFLLRPGWRYDGRCSGCDDGLLVDGPTTWPVVATIQNWRASHVGHEGAIMVMSFLPSRVAA